MDLALDFADALLQLAVPAVAGLQALEDLVQLAFNAAQAAVRPWREWLGSAGFEWEGGPAPTVLDRRRLAQALGNLMANAAEHGAGQVQVRGRTTARGVRIEVRNRLRADGGRRAFPDRGRGLAIATRAARDLGGRLLVSFDGERAVAVLELPLTALEPSDGPSGAEAA